MRNIVWSDKCQKTLVTRVSRIVNYTHIQCITKYKDNYQLSLSSLLALLQEGVTKDQGTVSHLFEMNIATEYRWVRRTVLLLMQCFVISKYCDRVWMAAGGLVSFSGTMVTLTALDACNVSSLCNVTV